MSIDIGRTGVWSAGLRYGDRSHATELVAELESLGYSAVWLPDAGGDLWAPLDSFLSVTSTMVVATGILNVWHHEPVETAREHARLIERHGTRLMCGIGISHRERIDQVVAPGTFTRPVATMSAYLDGLDAATPPLAPEHRMLAALGPRMTELARTRTAGSHPYLVTPEWTARAREGLGPERLVATEQAVVLETRAIEARTIARRHLSTYLELTNYVENWRRQGFDDDDFVGGGSNRLVDALVAWGDAESIAARVQQHRDAGADHVCIQALPADPRGFGDDTWRHLAPVLV